MKIIILILLTTCVCISTSDYPAIKRRVYGGPPQGGPPRPPPQFMKKWGKPPQKIQAQFPQNRFPPMRNNRPKPQQQNNYNPGFKGQGNGHHGPVPNNFGGPKFQSNKPRPGPPGKGFFKNPVQQFKSPNIVPNSVQFPQETKIVPNVLPTKPEQHSFVSSPSIPEYDYHIQTNNIPINTQPIKQVGEIGPIHTIPAPNLGPADKSNHLEQKKKQLQLQQQQRYQQELKQQYVTEQPIVHQYQVTEPSELTHFHRDELNQATHQISHNPALSYQHLLPNDLKNLHAIQGQNVQGYQNLPSTLFVQDNFGAAPTNNNDGISIVFDHLHEDESAQDMAFSNMNHYQAMNSGYNIAKAPAQTQAIQSSFLQQQPQLLPQFMQALPGYIAQYQPDNVQVPNKNGPPDYQTFNYDEQSHQAQSKSDNSANFVSATYSLGLSDEIQPDQGAPQSAGESLNQAQIVQNYFGSRSDADIQTRRKDTDISNSMKSGFYSSVPSKEVADRLAQLQAAGRVNNNLMQINSSQNPEDDNEDDASIERSDKNETSDIEYDDDYSEEDQSTSDQDRDFGHKISSRQ
ncbi:uncharacterized protein LOC143196688 isoform X1 [Rhynchophorus ferrugineus]|uniref:uncharacterized protein LOC143196688 isoform X1 n=1 Tax=Rhynchophorus ferrugineus TaxID=354439 RepID=UPI003FCC36FF